MSVSLVTLTWNRKDIVEDASATLRNGGYPIDSLIWVDNGSDDGTETLWEKYGADVVVHFPVNQGCAKGFNAGFRSATTEWVAAPGCDMLFPDGWLDRVMQYAETFPYVDVWGTLFNLAPEHFNMIVAQRRLAPDTHGVREIKIDGMLDDVEYMSYVPAIIIGPMVCRKSVFDKIGYLPEDGLLYGYEDVRWAKSVRDAGIQTGLVLDIIPEHLGERDIVDYPEYYAWKQKQVADAILR